MPPSAYISLAVIGGVFVVLFFRRGVAAELVFLAGLLAVTLTGVITPADAFGGFANPAVVMIASLFVVAAGLRATGALDLVGQNLLGAAKTQLAGLLRLSVPVISLSALMNNTPVVAMLVPTVIDWCRRVGVSPSRMLIPLSYFAILGGACTLIGTSTNLVVNAYLLQPEKLPASQVANLQPMNLFEIGWVGFPCAIVGAAYLLLVGRRLLPDRTDLVETIGTHRREYLVEMLIQSECRLISQTVEAAGLRNLEGLFLIEIDRQGDLITPVAPHHVLQSGDRLVFTGVVSTIVDLEKIPGLVPAADATYVTEPQGREQRHLTEAVLSNSSPLIGSTVKEAKFRQLYNAAVIAVHRNGVRVTNKIGNIHLEAGDTLLLQTRTEFLNNFRNSRDFYLVSGVEGSTPRRHEKVGLSFALLGLLVFALAAVSLLRGSGLMTMDVLPPGSMAVLAVAVAVLMLLSRCLSMGEARQALDWQVLLTIGAALGLGMSLEKSGADVAIADGLVGMVGQAHPLFLLTVVFLLTVLLTETITNVAVAALMFPIAVELATSSGCNARPFVMAIAIAASCSFITPIGYQTNLMVMGPGGYQPRDYLKVGVPLTVLITITAVLLIPVVWPLK